MVPGVTWLHRQCPRGVRLEVGEWAGQSIVTIPSTSPIDVLQPHWHVEIYTTLQRYAFTSATHHQKAPNHSPQSFQTLSCVTCAQCEPAVICERPGSHWKICQVSCSTGWRSPGCHHGSPLLDARPLFHPYCVCFRWFGQKRAQTFPVRGDFVGVWQCYSCSVQQCSRLQHRYNLLHCNDSN